MKPLVNNPKIVSVAALKMLEHDYAVAWADRDLETCVNVLQKVLSIKPRNANALLLLGRMHGLGYDYDKAIACFEKAVEVSPKNQKLSVMIEAGNLSRDFMDPTIAEAFLQEAVDTSATVEAKLALAGHLFRIRKRDVSRTLVGEVLGVAPQNPQALFLWCQLNEGQADECQERLRILMNSQSGELRVRAAYQLAKVLDKIGDYDGAMDALSRGKADLMGSRNAIVDHRRKIHERFRNLALNFSDSKHSEIVGNARHFGSPRKLALLGGHPRSGTTLLEQVLDSHPGIISAEETENFNIFSFSPLMRSKKPLVEIDEVLNACSADDLKSARAAYFKSMDDCLDEEIGSRLLVDKNPSLTPLAPALFQIFPEIRFVTMIRDPRDVIISCYMQPFVPVDAVSGNYLTIKDTAAEVGSFMTTWSEIAKRFEANVCEIRYESMVEDLEGTARTALDFLGADWNEGVMNYDQHARERIVRSPTADAVTEKVHNRAKSRWKNYEKHLEPVLDELSPCLEKFGYA